MRSTTMSSVITLTLCVGSMLYSSQHAVAQVWTPEALVGSPVQKTVAEILQAGVNRMTAAGGAVVLMNIHTGQILSLAS